MVRSVSPHHKNCTWNVPLKPLKHHIWTYINPLQLISDNITVSVFTLISKDELFCRPAASLYSRQEPRFCNIQGLFEGNSLVIWISLPAVHRTSQQTCVMMLMWQWDGGFASYAVTSEKEQQHSVWLFLRAQDEEQLFPNDCRHLLSILTQGMSKAAHQSAFIKDLQAAIRSDKDIQSTKCFQWFDIWGIA